MARFPPLVAPEAIFGELQEAGGIRAGRLSGLLLLAGPMTKAELRQQILAQRAHLSPEERQAKSRAIGEGLFSLPEFGRAGRVLFFVGFGTEVVTLPMIVAALEQGKMVAAPKVKEDEAELQLRWLTDPQTQLQPGMMGILEPEDDCPLADVADFDLIVVPAVAWDQQGYRVGYGGGYYDRLLAQVDEIAKRLDQKPWHGLPARGDHGQDAHATNQHAGPIPEVGIGFDCQVVPEVPRADHDLGVDILITETSVLKFRS